MQANDDKPRVVWASDYQGWNASIFQIFGFGPKWAIRCGHCGNTFSRRLPMIDIPTVRCPACGALNKIPVEVE